MLRPAKRAWRTSPTRLRGYGRVPDWLATVTETDPDLKGLLDEVYSAANDEQSRLLSMGVRTVLDHVMIRMLGGDFGSFADKLEMMAEQGHVTETQRQDLMIVIDVGSASSHRSFKPPRELLKEMLHVMESIIRRHYVTGPMLATAKQLIPPRPPRQSKK